MNIFPPLSSFQRRRGRTSHHYAHHPIFFVTGHFNHCRTLLTWLNIKPRSYKCATSNAVCTFESIVITQGPKHRKFF
jgi:hypothetical protein